MSWFDLILSSYQFLSSYHLIILSSYHLIWIYLLENLWCSKIFEVTTSCCSSCLSLIQTFENLCPVAHPQLIFPSACSFAEFRAWQCWISTSQCFLVSLTLKKKSQMLPVTFYGRSKTSECLPSRISTISHDKTDKTLKQTMKTLKTRWLQKSRNWPLVQSSWAIWPSLSLKFDRLLKREKR